MLNRTSFTDQLTFFQKVRGLDYVLIGCILVIGIISSFSMYSTDGGEFLYHSKSHILRFIVFFTMMICLSFFSVLLHTFLFLLACKGQNEIAINMSDNEHLFYLHSCLVYFSY